MEYCFETVYDQQTLTAMARALRKIKRRKHSIFMRVLGLLVVVMGLYLSTPLGGKEFSFSARSLVSYAALLIILITLIWEDAINGYFARKRMLPGTAEADSVFTDEEYTTKTKAGVTHWNYQRIDSLAESRWFFIFIFNENHAQVYDKEYLTGGTEEEFRKFIEEKTGKKFKKI